MFGLFVPRQPRCLDDLRIGSLRLPGNSSWLRFGQDLQELWWRKVEVKCVADIDALPWVIRKYN